MRGFFPVPIRCAQGQGQNDKPRQRPMVDVRKRYNLPMRLQAILAGILVAMVLSGAGFGPVCRAGCTEAAQALSCGNHSAHEMQPGGMRSADGDAARMAGMPNCVACGSRGPIATTPAHPCGHDSIAEVRPLDGDEGTAAHRIPQSELGTAPALPARLAIALLSLAEPPGSRIISPIALHTTLRV
jgi:hypothetical protein